VLPATLDEYRSQGDPHYYGVPQYGAARRASAQLVRPRDIGAQGEQWRNVLLDQLRMRGANFFRV
jgi:hypothetical protein